MAAETIERALAGLDALDLGPVPVTSRLAALWSAVWPGLAAAAAGLLAWQLVAISGWRPDYIFPGPVTVSRQLAGDLSQGSFYAAVAITMQRAAVGYGLAVLMGAALGAVVARNRFLRRALGSLITGLQSMPSIAWFPLAILLFGLHESAIIFVVILGATPAIANGLISGIDQIPPLLIRSGRVLGAKGFALYRHVVLPASLPAFLAGLKQGWAFAWRSLMAGELLVNVSNRPSLGFRLQSARDFSDATELLAIMVVILVIGMLVDTLFRASERSVHRRWGLAAAE
jgi:NitT/TauT family transport system permease protein